MCAYRGGLKVPCQPDFRPIFGQFLGGHKAKSAYRGGTKVSSQSDIRPKFGPFSGAFSINWPYTHRAKIGPFWGIFQTFLKNCPYNRIILLHAVPICFFQPSSVILKRSLLYFKLSL